MNVNHALLRFRALPLAPQQGSRTSVGRITGVWGDARVAPGVASSFLQQAKVGMAVYRGDVVMTLNVQGHTYGVVDIRLNDGTTLRLGDNGIMAFTSFNS
jgi:hypothetical protein